MKMRFFSCVAFAATSAAMALWTFGGGMPPAHADVHNAGSLEAFGPDGGPAGACPLTHTDVKVDISGFIARVTLTQQFTNPFETPIEAVYTFPMSDRGAVDAMTMHIGERIVRGKIDRKEAARRIYEAAKAAGQTASLLDQERPNIFTQSVANILPGDDIRIEISYVEYLKYADGEYGFSFPMVVGPRYIPGDMRCGVGPAATGQVPDASKILPPVTPEGTRAGHGISLAVNLDAGVPVRAIESELHEVDILPGEGTRARIKLRDQDEIPNRDFVLKYRVAGDEVQDAVLTHAGDKGRFFTLILQPPDRVAPAEAAPKEMIFVIDSSGSMSGFPIEKAKATMKRAIQSMNPNDTFNLISFAGGLGYCFDESKPNTRENVSKALSYLANLQGGGGTEMMPAIRAALADQHDDERLRIVCFMTDGFIGNDMAILDAIQENRDKARVFSFGIGNGVNRFLLENMAREGRGAAEIVTLESDGDAAVERFHARINNPVLTDIELSFDGVEVVEVSPALDAIPDLFDTKPIFVTGKYTGQGRGSVTVRGRTADGRYEKTVPVHFRRVAPEHDVLASLWARETIDGLMAQDWIGMQQGNPIPDVKEQITQLGLKYSLVTQFTSFVAVEETVRNHGGVTTRVEVPVEMTDGVSYEGVYGTRTEAVRQGRLRPQALAPPMPHPKRSFVRHDVAEPMANAPATSSNEYFRAGGEVVEYEEKGAALGDFDQFAREVDEIAVDPSDVGKVGADKKPEASKLHPALRGLSLKTTDGAYDDALVHVAQGMVSVYVTLSDDGAESLDALRKLGANVLSHARSSKRVLVRVNVAQLEKLAALDAVRYISPTL